MFRPEGWEELKKKFIDHGKCDCSLCELVEDTADAMLEGLVRENQLDHIDVRGVRAKVVFIPEEE